MNLICHPERSEGSGFRIEYLTRREIEILRCAQNDSVYCAQNDRVMGDYGI